MRRLCLSLFVLLAAAPPLAAQGQRPRVRTEYMKSEKKTRVEANVLFVLNAPDQFLQLQLRAWHKGQQLAAPAEQIELGFYSYGLAHKHEAAHARQLSAVLDGQTLPLGQLSHQPMVAEKKGAEGLPQFAKLREAVGEQKLKIELMMLDISPAQFAQLAKAQSAEMQIGATRFALNDAHMSIIREFASHIIPAGGAAQVAAADAAEEAIQPDTPHAANNATLEDTLKWLKKELTKQGSTALAGRAQRLEAADFSGCKIKYRVVPVDFGPPPSSTPNVNLPGYRYVPPTQEYSLDLADLDPHSVVATTTNDGTLVSFSTRDAAPKITRKMTHNSEGRVTLIYDDQHLAGATLNLRKTKTAPDIAAALAHAVKQCQARP